MKYFEWGGDYYVTEYIFKTSLNMSDEYFDYIWNETKEYVGDCSYDLLDVSSLRAINKDLCGHTTETEMMILNQNAVHQFLKMYSYIVENNLFLQDTLRVLN